MEAKEQQGTGTLLALSSVLGLALLFPLICHLDLDSEVLRGSTVAQTMQDLKIHYLIVAGAAVLIPLFLDNVIDILFSGINIMAVVRTCYIFCFLLSFVGQIIILFNQSTPAYFVITVVYQLWLLTSLAFILLNRVLKVYNLFTVYLIGSVAYIFTFASVWYVTFHNALSLQIIQVMRYISGIAILLSLFPSALQVLIDIRTSKLRLWDFILANDDRTKVSAIITCAVVAVIVVLTVSSATLNRGGPLSLSTGILEVYFSACIVYVIMVTVLPRHIAKVHQANTLKSSLALKKTFMNFISHELRTSFTIVLGGLDVLEQQTKEGHQAGAVDITIKELKGSCSTGIDILNEFLDFEKLDAGLGSVEKSVQDPREFIQSTVSPFQLLAMKKGIALETFDEVGEAGCEVDVDEIKVVDLFAPYNLNNGCRSLMFFETFFRMP